MLQEIAQAADLTRLASLRDQVETSVIDEVRHGKPVRIAAASIAEANDTLLSRLLVITEASLLSAGLTKPAARYCWLTFGSDGRREQVVRTDQDTALVYEDPSPSEAEHAETYFRRLATEATAGLAACGFPPCPGENMASNPQWCKPLSAWKEYFRNWIRVPDEEALLHAATFFDFRPVSGERSLAETLRGCITRELGSDRTALILLAKNAIHNPPARGVFSRLIMEKHGDHKGSFDLKLRAIKPVTDAVRVLALDLGIHSITGTLERLERMAVADRSARGLCRGVVKAFEMFMSYRTLHGDGRTEGGRYLDVRKLDGGEQSRFRMSFGAVDALLETIRIRYQLDSLGLS
jgi:CBS domain-containing protein